MKKDQLMTIEQVITSLTVNTEIQIPIFDPNDFRILKPIAQESAQGVFLGRFEEYTKHFGLSVKMRGNGYMLLSFDGEIIMLPEWKSLSVKLDQIKPSEQIKVTVTEIIPLEKDQTYIRTAVVKLK